MSSKLRFYSAQINFLLQKSKCHYLMDLENFELELLRLNHSSNSVRAVLAQDVLTTIDVNGILKGGIRRTHTCFVGRLIL